MPVVRRSALVLPLLWVAALQATPINRAELPLEALLATEFAVESGDVAAASAWSAVAAQSLSDVSLVERSARFALQAQSPEAFGAVMARWEALVPESVARDALWLAYFLRNGDAEPAIDVGQRLLQSEAGLQAAVPVLTGPHTDGGVMARAALRGLLVGPLPSRVESWLAMAGVARKLNDPTLSQQWVAQLVARFPDDPRALLLEAERLSAAGQRGRARSVVRGLLVRSDLPVETRRIAAESLAVLGDSAGAARALSVVPPDARTLTLRGAWLAQAGDMAGLRGVRDEAAALYGRSPTPALRLLAGELSERIQDWVAAEGWYRPLQEGAAGERARLRLAVVLARQQRQGEATQGLRELQADEAVDGEVRRDAFLAEAELLEGRRLLAAADAVLVRGLAVLEDDPELQVARASIARRQRRYEDAEVTLRTVLARDAGHRVAQRRLGQLLLLQQRAAEAEPVLRAVFNAEPTAPAAAAWGEALWLLGRRDEAATVWSRGARIDPDDPVLLDTRRRLEASSP